MIQAPNPKDGKASLFLLRDDKLQELNYFKQRMTSWFVGERVVQDGALYLGTPVDPLFVLLPVLEAGAKKSLDKPQGNFCPLEDLAQEAAAAFPQLPLLMKTAKATLPLICQVKSAGGDQYYRLDDELVVAWLACKVVQLAEHLMAHGDANFQGLGETGLRRYSAGLLGEYVAEAWLAKVRTALRIGHEPVPAPVPSSSSSLTAAAAASSSGPSPPASSQKRPAPVKPSPATKAQATKMAKLAKDAKDTRKLSSFFAKPKAK